MKSAWYDKTTLPITRTLHQYLKETTSHDQSISSTTATGTERLVRQY